MRRLHDHNKLFFGGQLASGRPARLPEQSATMNRIVTMLICGLKRLNVSSGNVSNMIQDSGSTL
jgi:hypothetical protein